MSPTPSFLLFFFFFNDTATTEIYTLSLHDALPILGYEAVYRTNAYTRHGEHGNALLTRWPVVGHQHEDISDHRFEQRGLLRSEEHTSELQSPCNLVCRLLLEKKKEATILSVRDTAS